MRQNENQRNVREWKILLVSRSEEVLSREGPCVNNVAFLGTVSEKGMFT